MTYRYRHSRRHYRTDKQLNHDIQLYKKWKEITKSLLFKLWKNNNFCKKHNSYYNKIVFKEEEKLTTNLEAMQSEYEEEKRLKEFMG